MDHQPLVCVTVTAGTTAELCRKRDEVSEQADLVELRLDSVRDPDVAGALRGRRGKVIVTVRPRWEGGSFDGSEAERLRLLTDAVNLGADYVDLEWHAGHPVSEFITRTKGRGIVLSMHDFTGMPTDLSDSVQAMRSTGAEVVKVAVTARCLSDCAELLRLGRHGKQVLIAMGDHGVATRVLAGRFGSAWTYAGSIHDIGQLTVQSLLVDYRFRSISDSTRVYGVVARSVTHSVSPAMHNAAFRTANLDAVFLPLPATSAEDFVRFGRAIGIAGASVTMPFKVALCGHMDALCPVARRVGALNTVRVEDGRWMGANTDVSGFLRPLKSVSAFTSITAWGPTPRLLGSAPLAPLSPNRAAVLGAGGAARAVIVALVESGAQVRVHARDRAKAAAATNGMPVEIGPWPPEPGSWDLLVNCTPVGMIPHVDESPVPEGFFLESVGPAPAAVASERSETSHREWGWGPTSSKRKIVYDLIYNPGTTRLLREAADAGCQTIGGLDMLVAQAQEQFRWWTGSEPAPDVMRAAATARLAEFM